jgi:flagellar hook assembly protein FlgD
LGRHVRTLVAAAKPAGSHSIPWNGLDETGREVPSGVYLCRLRAGSQEAKHRMLLLK